MALEGLILKVYALNGEILCQKENVNLFQMWSEHISVPDEYTGICIVELVFEGYVYHYKVVITK